MQFAPSEILAPYIKSYSVVDIDRDLVDEVFYPSGYIDFAVNISSGSAATNIDGNKKQMPEVELLGHLTVPTKLDVRKGTSVLIARIHPHASSLFFPNPISEFTNQATDLYGLFSKQIDELHDKMMSQKTIDKKIAVFDQFLIQKLTANEKAHRKAQQIKEMCDLICTSSEPFDLDSLSNRYGISERYIQKLFLEVVGLTPRSFFSVHRFNKSLDLVLSSRSPLTSIAYDCGYYDQAHFIKEFKKFTGATPSEIRPFLSDNGLEFQHIVNIGL